MAPATPEREFSKEIVIGISAPPTRTEKYKPNKAEVSTVPKTHHPIPVPAVVPIQIKKTVATNNTKVITECEAQIIGFCGKTRCSLPAATKLPTNVIIPTAIANKEVNRTKGIYPFITISIICSPLNATNVADKIPTKAEAPPPSPLNRATV